MLAHLLNATSRCSCSISSGRLASPSPTDTAVAPLVNCHSAGPFGSKNFATTISPWIITLDALEPFKCPTSAGAQDPPALPYLRDPQYGSYDVQLEVALQPQNVPESEATVISRSNYKHMYWNLRQQLVHHAVTGCNMRPGDLLGSGTISGPVSTMTMMMGRWRAGDWTAGRIAVEIRRVF